MASSRALFEASVVKSAAPKDVFRVFSNIWKHGGRWGTGAPRGLKPGEFDFHIDRHLAPAQAALAREARATWPGKLDTAQDLERFVGHLQSRLVPPPAASAASAASAGGAGSLGTGAWTQIGGTGAASSATPSSAPPSPSAHTPAITARGNSPAAQRIANAPPLRMEPYGHLRQSASNAGAPPTPLGGVPLAGPGGSPPTQSVFPINPSGPSAVPLQHLGPPPATYPPVPGTVPPRPPVATPVPPTAPATWPRVLAGLGLGGGAGAGLSLLGGASAPSGGAANLGPSPGTAKPPGTGQNTAAYYSRFRPSRQDAPDTGAAKPGPGAESAGLARGGPGPGASDSQTPGGTTDQILSFLKSYGLPIGLGVGGLGLLGYAMSGNKDDEEEEDGVVPRRRKAAAFPLGGYAGLAQILKARHTNPAPATPVGAQIDRFIGEHPFVTGFLLKCADAKLDDAQIREAILAAKRVSPSVAQVFTGSRL